MTSTQTTQEAPTTATDLWRGYYYEELKVGQRFDGGRVTITEAHVVAASQLFGDFHPFHVDDLYVGTTPFGKRFAHGILTAGLVISPINRIMGKAAATHLEDHIRYTAPVFIGDTVHAEIEVLSKEPRSRFGLVRFRHTGTDQDGKTVVEVETVMGHQYKPELA
jgi:3-hydroxybutyryl-CoA dehydratase